MVKFRNVRWILTRYEHALKIEIKQHLIIYLYIHKHIYLYILIHIHMYIYNLEYLVNKRRRKTNARALIWSARYMYIRNTLWHIYINMYVHISYSSVSTLALRWKKLASVYVTTNTERRQNEWMNGWMRS